MNRNRPSRLCLALFLAASLFAGAAYAESDEAVDEDYQKLLAENPDTGKEIGEVESALAAGGAEGAAVAAWQETLSADPELAKQESLFTRAIDEDEVLEARLHDVEKEVAADPEAAAELAAYDSLLAADPDLAELMEEVERAAAEDEDYVDEHGEQAAWLEENPEEAEKFFADEEGPSWSGSDPGMILYVNYMIAHPALYRAHWRLYRHFHAHRPAALRVYRHWRWLAPRPVLRVALRRYHQRAARVARVHEMIWRRRIVVAHRPWLGHQHWRYRAALGSKPALRKPARFLARNPRIARGIVHHQRWVKKHHPPRTGKVHKAVKPVKMKVKQKPVPPKHRRQKHR